ncbi:hypothetical protein [Ramlibacter sp. WS9]|uniref:hypothetical protein n=1 Tax=Ramlibacter sp. WS9 TaxID=1882741 RepID=UPI00114432BD|nr:hypothetical protein [Ramlibacter sp. WS9]
MTGHQSPSSTVLASVESKLSESVDEDCIEQVVFRRDRFCEWPFFKAFDDSVGDFLNRSEYRHQSHSYVIWGGVASDVLLGVFGASVEHYSLHDIEFFFVCDGHIATDNAITSAFNSEVSTDPRFLLELGGGSIVQRLGYISVLEFQRQRALRRDGDLFLNSVALAVDRKLNSVIVSAPRGTIESIGRATLLVKDSADISSASSASRRICRNVSKAIRYERVAALHAGPDLTASIAQLVRLYCKHADDHTWNHTAALTSFFPSDWILGGRLTSAQERKTWLWTRTLSEVSKRLAGLSGCSSLDFLAFKKCVLTYLEELSGHPLMLAVRQNLLETGWCEIEVDAEIIKGFFTDFQRYQKPFAETLRTMYSPLARRASSNPET